MGGFRRQRRDDPFLHSLAYSGIDPALASYLRPEEDRAVPQPKRA
jgi:hypothetical protein